MMSERKEKDRVFVQDKWRQTMDNYNKTIESNMQNNNRIHMQKFAIPIRKDTGDNTVAKLALVEKLKRR
jgi:hypothetical protein